MQNTEKPVANEDLNHILKARRDKLAELQAEGKDPFVITTYDQTHHSQEIKDHFDSLEGKEVSIAGRLMLKRVMGKASFCHVADRDGSIQAYVARDSVGEEAYKAFKKLEGVPVRIICPSHGLIWRKDPGKVLALYDKWSKYEAEDGFVIAYASMYGNTEKFADEIARQISALGVRDIRVYDVSKTHVSYLLTAIWKYRGLVLGSCAYNTGMHPMMALLTHEISVSAPQNKILGLFGGSSWNGAGVKALKEFAEKAKMPVTGDPAEFLGRPFASDLEKTAAFAKTLVDAMRG